MAQRFGPLIAEVTNPEGDKFTAPLILVHGLWQRAAAWRRFAGYLAHRGWRCIALERRAEASDVAAHVGDLRGAIASLDAAPVVLGHDLGANLALACSDVARAAIALAPLAGPPHGAEPAALRHAGNWLSRRRGGALRAPGGRWLGAYPSGQVREPAALVRQAWSGAPALTAAPAQVPRAVFAMEQDEVTPPAAAQALARHVGAEWLTLAGGHAALSGPGWEHGVAAVHRWVVRRLGVDLLAYYDEAMNPE